jgi:hypothetical protein
LIYSRGQRNIFKSKGATGVISPENALLFGKVNVEQPPSAVLGQRNGAQGAPYLGIISVNPGFFHLLIADG